MKGTIDMEFQQEYQAGLSLIEKELSGCFIETGCSERLWEAMRYSLLAGGKRIRPILTLKFCQAVCGEMEPAVDYACAVEMLHTYSLIHDDMPCMDNDDLRRGKPTCHRKYGEWLALLAGDALQTAAFERIAGSRRTGAEANGRACGVLAGAAGAGGMCAGQYLDMVDEGRTRNLEQLIQVHTLKTSALLKAACLLGLTASSKEPSAEQWAAAERYAQELGLAFQIRDDMLDVQSTTEELGKPVGSDTDNGKVTFATIYSLEECARLVEEHTRLAEESVAGAFEDGEFLCLLAKSLAFRKK